MKKKRIYIMYAPGGNGHRSNAKMIKETFNRRYPEHELIIEDISQVGNGLLKFGFNFYDNMLKVNPKYVKYGFKMLDFIENDRYMAKAFPKVVEKVQDRIQEINPDLIVSVHSSINHFVIKAMKNLGIHRKVPFSILVTDMTDKFICSWVNTEADLMIAYLEESRQQILDFGMPPDRIEVLGGTAVNPLFKDTVISKEEARKQFGLDEKMFTVLIMSGGIGLKNNFIFAKHLINSNLPVQILACCGKNKKLKAQIDRIAKKSKKPIKVFGFTDKVPYLMSAADVIITKPGPAVIAESIYKELPIVLDGMCEIMPQEAGNVDYVINQGVGKVINELSQFHNHIASLIYNDMELPIFRANMKKLNKDEASDKLADLLVRISNEGTELIIRENKIRQSSKN